MKSIDLEKIMKESKSEISEKEVDKIHQKDDTELETDIFHKETPIVHTVQEEPEKKVIQESKDNSTPADKMIESNDIAQPQTHEQRIAQIEDPIKQYRAIKNSIKKDTLELSELPFIIAQSAK